MDLFFIFLTFNLIFLFPVFVQTLRNIIVFFLIIAMTSCLTGLLLNMEFYPVFLVLVYLGAIVVSTLFVILTFDIREEYRLRDTTEGWVGIFIIQAALMCLAIVFLPAVITDVLSERHERTKAFRTPENVCSYVQAISRTHADADVLSATTYSSFSEYFMAAGIILTMALFVALAIAKPKKNPTLSNNIKT